MKKIISILIVILIICCSALPALATDGHYSYEIFIDSVLDTWVSDNDKEIFAKNENFESYYASNKDKNSIVYYSYINGYVDFRIFTFVLESFSCDTNFITIQNKNRTLSSINHSGYVDNSFSNISSFGTMSSNEGFIVVDSFELYEAFKSINSTCNVYFADNPIRSVYEYVYDIDSYYLCDKVDGYKSMLRYYDCFDSPAGVNDKVYQDEYENWVSASVSFKDDVYFSSTKISNKEADNQFMHNEMFRFYIIPNEEYQARFSADYNDSITAARAIAKEYMDNNIAVTHYSDGVISFVDWYQEKILPSMPSSYSSSGFNVWKINKVAVSNDKNITVNGNDEPRDIYYISFWMPDTYTYLDSQDGHSVLSGYHTQHWYPEIDISNGIIINNSGFGSDISNSDFADHPDRDVLLQQGWQSGYPNNSGDYPYKITCNVNGEPYLNFYFSKMPGVTSTLYSNSMIKYSVDFFNTEGYIYDPVANCSTAFDFTNLYTENDANFNTENYFEIGGLTLRDPIDAIVDFLGKSAEDFAMGSLSTQLGVDYYDFSENFKMYLWTNYTGSITANKYKGYYVQFNWNLEEADNFIKDSSSDDYDYSQDYLPDDGFKDNNGNTHGGGIITDTSAGGSGSTDSTVTQFDFNDTNLWLYANGFLKFSAAAFTVLPGWIWALLGTSMTILIVLRILGR